MNRHLSLLVLAVFAAACVKEEDPWKGKEKELVSPPASLPGVSAPPPNVANMNWDQRIELARSTASDNKIDEASDHYLACIKLAEAFPAGDQRFFTTLVEAAYFYYFKGRHELAVPLFERTVREREKVKGADSLELAKDLQNLGNVYAFKGRLAEAEPVFKRAVEIREKNPNKPSPDPEMASLLHDYADLLGKMSRPEEAGAMEKRSQAAGGKP